MFHALKKLFFLILLKIFQKNMGGHGGGDFSKNFPMGGESPPPVPPIFAPNGKPWYQFYCIENQISEDIKLFPQGVDLPPPPLLLSRDKYVCCPTVKRGILLYIFHFMIDFYLEDKTLILASK